MGTVATGGAGRRRLRSGLHGLVMAVIADVEAAIDRLGGLARPLRAVLLPACLVGDAVRLVAVLRIGRAGPATIVIFARKAAIRITVGPPVPLDELGRRRAATEIG